jgi:hypothetical protein
MLYVFCVYCVFCGEGGSFGIGTCIIASDSRPARPKSGVPVGTAVVLLVFNNLIRLFH